MPENQHQLLVFITAFAPADKGAIQTCHLNRDSGEMKLIGRTTDIEHPFFIALAPNGRTLFAVHEPKEFGSENHGYVSAYEILGDSGKLKLINRQSALGSGVCYLDVDVTSKTLVVAHYTSGSIAAFPIGEDGSLGEAGSLIQHQGASVNPERQQGPHAHCIVVSPDNKHVFAADLGLDQIINYALDTATASLSSNRQPFVRTLPGAGPRHLTFHPNGQFVYVINELDNSVTMFNYDCESAFFIEQQTLSTLPPDFNDISHCADLKISANGRYLYATNRGHDSIACYQIDMKGRLQLLGIENSHGQGPQNLAITDDGNLLLCANFISSNVAVFRIAQDSGKLTCLGDPVSYPHPSCILIVDR